MTTNPTSMTISAENDTKGAAKQVLTFFFYFGDHPTFGRSEATRTRNAGNLQKKGRHPNFRCKVGRDLGPLSTVSCGFIKRPAFYHEIMVTLLIRDIQYANFF